MANKNHFTADDFIKAIPGTGGIVTAIARRLGCDWDTAKKYITRYPTIARAYAAEKEMVKDIVESSLITKAKEGESWAVKYYLSTQAKDRGYIERQEVDMTTGGEPVGKAIDRALSKIYGRDSGEDKT